MVKSNKTFLDYFPDHVYRYIDQTGDNRPPISSAERRNELNINGYESYFTVNGFKGAPNAQKNSCSSLNAFFVDIDGRKDLNELEEIKKKLDPTFIIETKNGYHIYWLLDEPIFKNEITADEWDTCVKMWERIEENVVNGLDADKPVKDLTRILRVPDTFYWKKTGAQYKKGTEGVFKIKGIYKNVANRYTMQVVDEAFPPTKQVAQPITDMKAGKRSEAETKRFFDRVNEEFPMEERESFKRLISGHPDTLPPGVNCRNQALVITASLMKQAGWSKEKAIAQLNKVGWHGMEAERGGSQEIMNTVNSAYNNDYTYSYKNEIIAHNISEDELLRLRETYQLVFKERKEADKVRFSIYEREILAKRPYLKKNEIGIIFDYKNGVYKQVSDQDISGMVINGLDKDMLWNYKTKKNVADKIACLLAIIPDLEITDDKGYIANVKNGLLNIRTRELMPHDPNFVSFIQYPVDYDPKATCPVWLDCLDAWMAGEEQKEKTLLLQQFAGYCLSSSMFYDRALFMVGDGGNGKSTFVDTIAMIIGKEATSHIDLESLYGQFGMQGLIGKRLNIIEEVHGNYYQSNKLKKLISGETVTIDVKYKPQYTFRPQAKFVFAVNQMPRVDDISTATERRICAVTFKNNFRKNPNTKLRSEIGLLWQERSGILNWMLDGADSLREMENFIVTEEQMTMLNEYRQENSSVEGFLAECIMLEPGCEIEVPTLYSEYKKWSQSDGGRKIKANITFTKEVKAYGEKKDRFTYVPREHGKDNAKFIGIKLSPNWTNQHESFQKYGI